MNKLITLIALATLTGVCASKAQSDNKRLVLIEEFSNTGCGPCASYSPILDSVVSYRLGEVISVKYHGNYPDASDPFYLAQRDDIDRKIAFYDITAYPTTVINGYVMENCSSEYILNNAINVMQQQPENYKINLNSNLTDGTLHLSATVTPQRDTVNANLRLNIVVIEEYYEDASAFSNGETHVRNITRKILPDANGYNIGDVMKAGESYTYTTDWAVTGFGNTDQLGVVAFLQDVNTKEVLATAYVPKAAKGTNKLCLMNVEGTPDNICTPNYYGKVTFRNEGENTITSATLNVNVNGTLKTYSWTGDISYLDKATLDFDDFTNFALNAVTNENTAEVWLSDINGTSSESNHMTLNFANAVKATSGVMLRIYTDNKPEETTWKVYNSAGDVVDEGGPYETGRKVYDTVLRLTADDCYTLEFYDAGGDGIVGNYGNGYFILYQYTADKKKKNIRQGDYDGSTYTVDFSLTDADATLGIKTISTADGTDKATLRYNLSGQPLGNSHVKGVVIENGEKVIGD